MSWYDASIKIKMQDYFILIKIIFPSISDIPQSKCITIEKADSAFTHDFKISTSYNNLVIALTG